MKNCDRCDAKLDDDEVYGTDGDCLCKDCFYEKLAEEADE